MQADHRTLEMPFLLSFAGGTPAFGELIHLQFPLGPLHKTIIGRD